MRLTSPGIYKAAFWAIGIIVAVKLLTSGVLLEPLFLFLTAGTIPWTNVQMTPDAILTALPFMFGFIVLLIFHAEVWKLLRWIFIRSERPRPRLAHEDDTFEVIEVVEPEPRRPAVVVPIASAAPVTKAMPAPRPVLAPVLDAVAIMLGRVVAKVSRITWLASLKRWIDGRMTYLQPQVRRLALRSKRMVHDWLVRLIPLLHTTAYYAGVLAGRTGAYARVAWVHMQQAARFIARIIRIESRNLARFIATQAARLWEWLAPYLWRADRWLGVQFDALVRHPYVRHAKHVIRDFKRQILALLKK